MIHLKIIMSKICPTADLVENKPSRERRRRSASGHSGAPHTGVSTLVPGHPRPLAGAGA